MITNYPGVDPKDKEKDTAQAEMMKKHVARDVMGYIEDRGWYYDNLGRCVPANDWWPECDIAEAWRIFEKISLKRQLYLSRNPSGMWIIQGPGLDVIVESLNPQAAILTAAYKLSVEHEEHKEKENV